MQINLYRISQDVNTGYDTYDSAVVAASSPNKARIIHPNDYDGTTWRTNPEYPDDSDNELAWVNNSGFINFWSWVDDPSQVKVELIGVAVQDTKIGVIVASFNAG